MNKQEKLQELKNKFTNINLVDLNPISQMPIFQQRDRLISVVKNLYKSEFSTDERIVFVLDYKDKNLLITLQIVLNEIDISNFFCIFVVPGKNFAQVVSQEIKKTSSDKTDVCIEYFSSDDYNYNSPDPLKINLQDLSSSHQTLLSESKVFCIYPWIHLHTYPTGEAWPCCHAEMAAGKIGTTKKETLEEIWNNDRMKELRCNMLNGKEDRLCVRCYEQEESGFFSGRQSANKHHGHHIHRVDKTQSDGTYADFHMTYWDIRFSNLCNLRCRSCGHIFSSQWYQDQVKLAGPEWKAKNTVLNYAGRTETDMWEQLEPHLDYVEQIYFAGGEPLMMEEHYRILDELERRNRFDVRLVYNTNFTHTKLKNRSVFDYWKKFEKVSVGASLDGMGPHAEYIRKGTDWDHVERNRLQMMETCPDVDFYISSTMSIMNAWHLPEFHKNWTERGFINAQDFNINILQDPAHYRIDIAPMKYKQRLRIKIEEHLEWLKPLDKLNRARVGFESAIKFMMNIDNSSLLAKFWSKTQELDTIRGENILSTIPELEALYENTAR